MGGVDKLGVYVSVPFCRAKCSFCNFASGVGKAGEIEAYVARLCTEIQAASDNAQRLGARLPRAVDTVYLGGGTPSLLTPAQLQQIFAVRQDKIMFVKGDPDLNYGTVADVINMGTAAGVTNIGIITPKVEQGD